MVYLRGAVLAAFFLPYFVFAQNLAESLDDLVVKYERRDSFQGNILIKEKGKVIYTKSVGFAHVETKSFHTIDSKFMIASISKTFTAAAILKLESRGELSLEDSVNKYITLGKDSKVSQVSWEKIKIKHLLNHTSGLIRDFKEGSFLNRSDFNTLDDIMLKGLQDEKTIFFEAGERFYYSNFGYVVLAAIIDKVVRGSFKDHIRAHFLLKQRMNNTGEFHRSNIIFNMADGYFFDASQRQKKRCCDDTTSLKGAAGMYSTVEDMSAWVNFLNTETLENGKTFLEAMLEEQVLMEEGKFYGYGMMNDAVHGENRIFHNGHEWGYVSSLSYFPEKDIEIVVLANRHGFIGFSGKNSAEELSKDLAGEVLKLN